MCWDLKLWLSLLFWLYLFFSSIWWAFDVLGFRSSLSGCKYFSFFWFEYVLDRSPSVQRFSTLTSTAMEAFVLTFSKSSGALPLQYPRYYDFSSLMFYFSLVYMGFCVGPSPPWPELCLAWLCYKMRVLIL
jgi:hypothetical protein